MQLTVFFYLFFFFFGSIMTSMDGDLIASEIQKSISNCLDLNELPQEGIFFLLFCNMDFG